MNDQELGVAPRQRRQINNLFSEVARFAIDEARRHLGRPTGGMMDALERVDGDALRHRVDEAVGAVLEIMSQSAPAEAAGAVSAPAVKQPAIGTTEQRARLKGRLRAMRHDNLPGVVEDYLDAAVDDILAVVAAPDPTLPSQIELQPRGRDDMLDGEYVVKHIRHDVPRLVAERLQAYLNEEAGDIECDTADQVTAIIPDSAGGVYVVTRVVTRVVG